MSARNGPPKRPAPEIAASQRNPHQSTGWGFGGSEAAERFRQARARAGAIALIESAKACGVWADTPETSEALAALAWALAFDLEIAEAVAA
jgi:hypothetical protein